VEHSRVGQEGESPKGEERIYFTKRRSIAKAGEGKAAQKGSSLSIPPPTLFK